MRFAASLFLILATASCSGKALFSGSASSNNHAPAENTAAPVDALEGSTHAGLEACSSSVSSADLDASLDIARDFEQSAHELIVCGGLATNFSSGVINVLLSAAIGGTSPSVSYVGKGTYTTGAGGTNMRIKTTLGTDTSFGKKGDIIDYNLLDLATYFESVKITATASIDTTGTTKQTLTVAFTNTGPGFELLGLGATPKSPLTISADTISDALAKILIATEIHVDDKKGDSVFTYDVTTASQPMSAALAGDPVDFALTGLSGTHVDQTLTITKFEIGYLDTGSTGFMNGTIAFDVKGGKLPYSASFHYPNRKTPDVTLACAK